MRFWTTTLLLLGALVVVASSILVWRRMSERRLREQLEPYLGRDLGALSPEEKERVGSLVDRIAPGLGRPGDYGNSYSLWSLMPIQTARGRRTVLVSMFTGSAFRKAPLLRCILFDERLRRLHETSFAGARDSELERIQTLRPPELGCEALEIVAKDARLGPPLYVSAEGDRLNHVWGKPSSREDKR